METYLPPNRQLTLKLKAFLKDTPSTVNNFEGWLIAQMHLAGKTVASKHLKKHVEAIAINNLIFHQSILLEEEISCYAEVICTNRNSLTLQVEAWSRDPTTEEGNKIIEGTFTYIPSGGRS